jgi:hypothetical protein
MSIAIGNQSFGSDRQPRKCRGSIGFGNEIIAAEYHFSAFGLVQHSKSLRQNCGPQF